MNIECDSLWVLDLQAFGTFYADLADAKWTALIFYRNSKTLRTHESGEFSGSNHPIHESI